MVKLAQFRGQLDAQLQYFAQDGAPRSRIANWLNDLLVLMDSLKEFPLRFPVAETESDIEGLLLRRVVFGAYPIFYRVDEAREVVQP